MDPDLTYDLHHRVVPSQDERCRYEQTYRDAWRTYYARAHRTVARRRVPVATWPSRPVHDHVQDHVEAEGVHPLEGGLS